MTHSVRSAKGLSLLALASALTVATTNPAGAQTAESSDPDVVAARTAAAQIANPEWFAAPATVSPARATTMARVNAGKTLSGRSDAGGYSEVGANDWAANDNPGIATTTLRIWGNAAAWRTGNGKVELTSQFTCTGAGISGLSVGLPASVSISGGATSSTLTWKSSRTDTSEVRQSYAGDGHFRCKASNLSPAKTTRRGISVASYKTTDVRAQGEYSFWW